MQFYLNIFIISNLYLVKLMQSDNQRLDFNYNYYNFFNDIIICEFYFHKTKILIHSYSFLCKLLTY
jgi:hypothetical protein